MKEKPEAIIKTMPASWAKDLSGGVSKWEKEFMSMNDAEEEYWVFNLSSKPKYEVLYFYLLFDGAVRFRASILGYKNYKAELKCYDGTYHSGRIWVSVSAPIIKARTPIPMKGFQGFRYTQVLF